MNADEYDSSDFGQQINFQFNDEVFHNSMVCGANCKTCCYFWSGHNKILNTIADECFQFGGSSAGNYYRDGISSISDATYGVCGPIVYGCDGLCSNPGSQTNSEAGARTVSYTHLTLPTIYSV